MNNFFLTLNIVLPIFLVMLTGYFCKRIKLVTAENISAINKLVFRVFLPASLCQSLMRIDTNSIVNPGVLAFGFVGVLVVFLLGFVVIPRIEKDNRRRGVMIQGLFRSNYAIFGIPVCEALFPQGDGGVAAMMVIATVPLFNALSVVSLEVFRGGRVNAKKIVVGICKNPLIWGCIIGYLLMQFKVPVPEFATSTLSKLASIASPLALFALGGSVNLQTFKHNARPLSIVVLGRLLFIPLAALLAAWLIGYRGAEFAVMMIVFGSPCAVSSYTMAAQMDGDAELAAQQIMLTTIFSSVSMFMMIFAFKSLGIF